MCSSCAHHPAGSSAGTARSARWQWSVLGVFALIGIAGALISFTKTSRTNPSNQADHVFAMDSARQASGGLALARAAVNGRSVGLRRLGTLIEGLELAHVRSTAVGSHLPGSRVLGDRVLLGRLAGHARDDKLLARIEVASGTDPRLLREAHRLARSAGTEERAVALLNRRPS